MLGLTVFLSATVFAVAVAPADRTAYDAPEIPPTWTPTTRADPSAPITLHFLLHQPNIDALARHLDEVSDPSSKRYGQHLSMAEVNALSAPLPAAVPSVRALFSHDSAAVAFATPNGDMLKVSTTIAAAEAALDCEYFVYTRLSDGETAYRTSSYTLPRHVAEHVDAVVPTVMLHSLPSRTAAASDQQQGARTRKDASTGHSPTPKTLRARYRLDAQQGDPQKATANRQVRLPVGHLAHITHGHLHGTHARESPSSTNAPPARSPTPVSAPRVCPARR